MGHEKTVASGEGTEETLHLSFLFVGTWILKRSRIVTRHPVERHWTLVLLPPVLCARLFASLHLVRFDEGLRPFVGTTESFDDVEELVGQADTG